MFLSSNKPQGYFTIHKGMMALWLCAFTEDRTVSLLFYGAPWEDNASLSEAQKECRGSAEGPFNNICQVKLLKTF